MADPAATTDLGALVRLFELSGIAVGAVAVAALVHGAVLLLRETRLAVGVLTERVRTLRSRIRP